MIARAKITIPVVLMALMNIVLIFLGARFIFMSAENKLLPIIGLFLILGTLGVFIIFIYTTSLKLILKHIFSFFLALVIGLGIYYYFTGSENIIQRHYAVMLTGFDDNDLQFSEYWFPDSSALALFLSQARWYMDERDRREMLSYYSSVRAEE